MSRRIETISKSKVRSGFVKVENTIAQDLNALSPYAFRLYVSIMSRATDWKINLSFFVNRHMGYRTVLRAAIELRHARYLVKLESRKGDKEASYYAFSRPQSDYEIACLEERTGLAYCAPSAMRESAFAPGDSCRNTNDLAHDPSDPRGSGGTDPLGSGVVTDGAHYKERTKKDDKAHACACAGVNKLTPDKGGFASLAGTPEPAQAGQEVPAGGDCDALPEDDPEAEAEKMALANAAEWVQDEPDGQRTLIAEEVPASDKGLPWPLIKRALKEHCPTLRVIDSGSRRDGMIRKFWRESGQSVGAFEMLARRVEASDFLMARNGHAGHNGKPFGWAWVFSYREREVAGKTEKTPRWQLVLDGLYDNDRQEEIRRSVEERKAKEAAAGPKLSRVMIVGMRQPQFVNLAELFNGQPRYEACGKNDFNDLPEFFDKMN